MKSMKTTKILKDFLEIHQEDLSEGTNTPIGVIVFCDDGPMIFIPQNYENEARQEIHAAYASEKGITLCGLSEEDSLKSILN